MSCSVWIDEAQSIEETQADRKVTYAKNKLLEGQEIIVQW